jgi:hypothetical protein
MIDIKYQVPVWEKVNDVQLVSSYWYLMGYPTISKSEGN